MTVLVPRSSVTGHLILGEGPDGHLYPIATGVGGQITGLGGGTASSSAVARTVHLASVALPAAGAFTTQAVYAPVSGLSRYIAFWVTYTRGAVGGFARFKVEWGNGTETATELIIDETLTATAPTARQSGYLYELDGPVPANASALSYLVILENTIGATTVALRSAEAGVTGTPGTIAIATTGSG
jgi:hypothetical protein